jgi:hypothetical protein
MALEHDSFPISKAIPPQFWIYVNDLNPNDVFRVILCHRAMFCHRALNVWWCGGAEQLLFKSFREHMIAKHTLRTGVFLKAMEIVANSTSYQDDWVKVD